MTIRVIPARTPFWDLAALRTAADYFDEKDRFAATVIAKILRKHADHLQEKVNALPAEEQRDYLRDVHSRAASLIEDAQRASADLGRAMVQP